MKTVRLIWILALMFQGAGVSAQGKKLFLGNGYHGTYYRISTGSVLTLVSTHDAHVKTGKVVAIYPEYFVFENASTGFDTLRPESVVSMINPVPQPKRTKAGEMIAGITMIGESIVVILVGVVSIPRSPMVGSSFSVLGGIVGLEGYRLVRNATHPTNNTMNFLEMDGSRYFLMIE